MGLQPAPNKCFITGFDTIDRPRNANQINYHIDYYGKAIHLSFVMGYENSDLIDNNKHIFRGLIANNKFNTEQLFDTNKLHTILESGGFPKTPKEKLDNFILFLGNFHQYDGSTINITNQKQEVIDSLYFKNFHEFNFYIDNLVHLGYISPIDTLIDKNDQFTISISFTLSGLNYLMDLQEHGENSKNCFIAMSFSSKANNTRRIIKLACGKLGYNPILVDETNINSDVTINDAIISNIKKSKFVIADFTEQKQGVYFEAGYALGKGKQVIYICSENDFSNVHFDTNHYPHIVYENLEDLEQRLIDKISAWIE